jgi:D-glycero-D-manno-heptose 1,7-bisphosphate phosphatase
MTTTNLAPHMRLAPALCLDWDGTIRRSKSGKTFIQNYQDIELIPGVEKIIWRYRSMGFLIIGISNQGGVSFGFKLPMEIDREMDVTLELFESNPFHIVKMCYHMEGGKVYPYNYRSLLRKPNIGMLAIAESEAFNSGYMIDWDKSLFVGDRPEDEECARNAGINFQHIDSFLTDPIVFEISPKQ